MRVLFVLSQRPELTGSGITLDALVREARAVGHDVFVLCGIPAGDTIPSVGGLDLDHVFTVSFGEGGDLPFDVPGMSDVMPYPSTVWSTLPSDALDTYRQVWARRLAEVVARVAPDVVHLNHLWVLSALAPGVLDGLPSVVHGHATGLRQMELCPNVRSEVIEGLRAHRAFLVLHPEHARRTAATLDVAPERVHVIGAGYRTDVFGGATHHPAPIRRGRLLYVGKYAAAKGLPWLLDACENRWDRGLDFELHVAGDGGGAEADALRSRMQELSARVILHGRLDQSALADLMRRSAVLVLPSLYEGLPLVLVEARACGCSLLSTALEGVVDVIAPTFGDSITLVPLPRRIGPDRPDPRDVDDFVRNLGRGLEATLARAVVAPNAEELAPWTWKAVFTRVEKVWRQVVATR